MCSSVSLKWKGLPLIKHVFQTVCALFAAAGLIGIGWYETLSAEQKAEADRLAIDCAKRLYNKAVHELTSGQLGIVQNLVKGHFVN
jgi:hypothetical protein